MKNFDTRVYNIADFEEWHKNGLLDLSPEFQRRAVWSEKAKSYLVDTIVRGKPMPKVLITQIMKGRRNIRTVVDGQQRIRAILTFITGDFKLSGAHNREYAGYYFHDLPEEIQDDFMQYEIGCDLLYDVPYKDLLDIFARINTYTVKLNSQELLNAKYLGYFKQNAYELGYKYVEYFLESKIITKSQVARMAEAALASDLLYALSDGIQTNKNIETGYKKYEDNPGEIETCVSAFDETMSYIGSLYKANELASTNWSRIHLFYTIFTVVAHARIGIKNLTAVPKPPISEKYIGRIRSGLDEISSRYDQYTAPKFDGAIPANYRRFIDLSRRRTTDTASRIGRTSIVCEELVNW